MGKSMRKTLTVWAVLLASLQVGATSITVIDGAANNYVDANKSLGGEGLFRTPSPATEYYRFPDAGSATAEVEFWDITNGNSEASSAPTVYGGQTWRDNVRPDDTSTFAGTVCSWRANVASVGDTLRSYIAGDNGGITADECFGAALFSVSLPEGDTVEEISVKGRNGRAEGATFSAEYRWVVQSGDTVYVSQQTFAMGTVGAVNTLSNVTAESWAAWDPADISDLKFSDTGASFGTVDLSGVVKAGYLWEMADTDSSSSSWNEVWEITLTVQEGTPESPVITSAGTASGNVGTPFSYQIEATQSPTGYGVTGTLPGGLSVDTASGLISGTPVAEESQSVTVFATNDVGSGSASLEITIGPLLPIPVISSPTSTVAQAGSAFTYQIEASNTPLSFDATGLPMGLSVDTVSGVISGSLVSTGTYHFTISAVNAAGSGSADLEIAVGSYTPAEPPAGQVYRCYFIGNSLTLSLTTANQPERARLERLFALRGNRLIFGASLGAGVNLDQHWMGRLYAPEPNENWMKQIYYDDQHEQQSEDGWAGPNPTFGNSFFRNYTFAFQGMRRDADGTIASNHVFDAIILQPYVAYLEPDGYTTVEQANGATGDRTAVSNFLSYATGNNPSGHTAAQNFYIYSAWSQCLGVEQAAIDTDEDGAYSFSEFYDSPYSPPVDPTASVNPRIHVPKRDYLDQLYSAACADHPELAGQLHVIPVGEVMAELDRLIRLGQLPGIEAYYTRNQAYYTKARAGEDITFNFIYPPGEPENWGNDFIAAQGIKNLYADNIHWNDQTHNTSDSGTLGAYIAAATIHTVITGDQPGRTDVADIAAYYEAISASEDGALVSAIQDVIWNVVTSTDWHGINYSERTGLADLAPEAADYRAFKAHWFSTAEQQDPAISGEEADPDGDGVKNVLEAFRQSNPTVYDGAYAIQVESGAGETSVSYNGLAHMPGMIPSLLVSEDLQTWSKVKTLSMPSAVPGYRDYVASLPELNNGFFRVALDYIPDSPAFPVVAWGASSDMIDDLQNLPVGKEAAVVDLATPANPAVGAAYQTDSPVFFAAAHALSGNTVSLLRLNNHQVPEDGTGDVLLLKLSKDTGTSNDGVITVLWKQEGDGTTGGFLNGGDSGNVDLANLAVRAKVGFGSGSVSQMRFVIQRMGQFYISDDCGALSSIYDPTGNTAPHEEIALSNPWAVNWYEFDPESDMVSFGSPVELEAFDNITAVGFNWRTYGDETLRYLYVESFRANGYAE